MRTAGGWRTRLGAARGGGGWLVEDATSQIHAALNGDDSWQVRVGRVLARAAREPAAFAVLRWVGAYYLVLTIIAVVADVYSPSLFPALRPRPSSEGLVALWGVQAGLVGAALPFLFAVIPLVADVEFAPTRTAQLLLQDSRIYPVLVFCLGGLTWLGGAVLWLDADGVKWTAALFVLVPSVAGVLMAYRSATRVISDRQYVQRETRALWLSLVDDYLIEVVGTEHANGQLRQLLGAFNIRPSRYLEPGYVPVMARRTGRIVDINDPGLRRALRRVGTTAARPAVQPQPNDGPPAELGMPDGDEPVGYWRALVGDKVEAGSPLLMLHAETIQTSDIATLESALDRCLQVEAA